MPVSELVKRMTWREFRYWAAYYKLEPWGAERADLAIAGLRQQLAGMLSDKARHIPIQAYMVSSGEVPRGTMTDEAMRKEFVRGAKEWNAMLSSGARAKSN